MLLARKSQRIRSTNRAVDDAMWIGTKGVTKEEEIRGKRPASAQSGRILERNAVVETRSVSVTPRRLRCRPSTTGCYRPPRSSHHARISSSIFTEDYACLLPPLHITPPLLHLLRSFSHPALRGVFSSPFRFFVSFGCLTLSLSTLSLPSVSHPPYKCFTLSHPLPNSTVTRSSLPLLLPF